MPELTEDQHAALTRKLLSTTDARVWAEEFASLHWARLQTQPMMLEDFEGLMLSWFANAIETGREAGRSREAERHADA